MLLVNVDDMLRLTGSKIRHENKKVVEDDKCIFFDTDKFLLNLGTMGRTVITADTLADIFANSFTEGYIDNSRD